MDRVAAMKSLIVFGMLVTAAAGCYYDTEALLYPGSANVDCSTVKGTFSNVKPIIIVKCATAGCHNAETAAGAAVLETYDQIKASANRINQRTLIDKTMPPGTPLSAAETAILKCWISSGMPDN